MQTFVKTIGSLVLIDNGSQVTLVLQRKPDPDDAQRPLEPQVLAVSHAEMKALAELAEEWANRPNAFRGLAAERHFKD